MSANRRGIGRGIGKFISTVTKVIDGINAINGISEQIQNIQPKPASNPKPGNSDQFDPIQVTNPIIDQYYSSENIRRMEENMRRMANQESEADYQGGVGGGVSEEEGYYSDYQGGSDYHLDQVNHPVMSANRRGIGGREIGKLIISKVIDGFNNPFSTIYENIQQNIQPKPVSNPKPGKSDQFDPIQVTNPIIDQYYSSENIRRMEENMRHMANLQESEADYQGGVGGGVSEEEGYYSHYQGGSDYQVGENHDYESGLNTANNRQLKLIGSIIAEQVLAPVVNELINSAAENSSWDQLSYSFLP